jgi:DNA-binding MarR family transcriptional regulator
MPRAIASAPAARPGRPTIRTLLAYRLHRLANQISRSAALHYRAQFGVSLAEWRTVALLGASAPLSLNELARSAGLHKSQMSRVVAGLVSRGLARRGPDARDGRTIRIALTASGRRLYDGLIAAADGRNERLLGCLSGAERRSLATVLQKLEQEARSLVLQEQFAAGGPRRRVKEPA